VACHLPFLLDDTKTVHFPDEVAKTIYGVVQGRGRGRGTVHGIAHQDYCVTVLFSSGEQPAISFTKDGGTRPRVLSFWGSPFGAVSPEMAKRIGRINRCIRENYGHAGPRFVQFLLQRREDWPEWRRDYDQYVKDYEKKAGDDAIAGRMATHFAALKLTSRLVHEALDLPWHWNKDLIDEVWEELTSVSGEADVAANALRLVLDWSAAHRSNFYSGSNSRSDQPHGGWVGRWDKDRNQINGDGKWPWIGLLPHKLEQVLAEGKFDYTATLRGWKDRGWLEIDDENRNTKKAKIGTDIVRVVAIKRKAVEAMGSDEEDEDEGEE
jgi:putative DNA primase/helicase